MKKAFPMSAILLPALATLLAACAPVSSTVRRDAEPAQGAARTVILTAFGDKAATFGETQPFLLALTDKVDRSGASAFCVGVYEGNISGQPVVIATTGTGGDNAGPCMQELLYQYGPHIREVIWSGIAGVSPAVGGVVDAAGRRRAAAAPVMIGDVCISALAWNYDLHFSSVSDWAQANPGRLRYPLESGWWPMKNSNGKADVIGFDNVQQFVIAERSLADALSRAAQTLVLPGMDRGVQDKVKRFFAAEQLRPVRFFDSTQCGEVAGNVFWHGVVEDRLSRQYLASLVTASGFGGSQPVTEDQVVTFSAMESAAWMSVLTRWNTFHKVKIPMAVVRSASNYDHLPLDAQGNPPLRSDGQPMNAMDDIMEGFQEAGAAYAANNAASVVLRMLALRGQPR